MDDVLGVPFLGAVSAFGWAGARVLMDGLAGAAGGWLFLTISCATAFWALAVMVTESDPYALYKHLAAIAAAAILLYAPARVDLSSVVNGRLGSFGYIDVNRGAAPVPTQIVDWIGSAASRTVKGILVGADQKMLPMLDQALKDAAADRANLQDRQVAMNVAAWRTLASAALAADSALAAAIDAQGLRPRLLNPAASDPHYAGAQVAQDAERVLAALQTASPGFAEAFCRNTASVAGLARSFDAVAWTVEGDCASADPGPVLIPMVSGITRQAQAAALQSAQSGDPAMLRQSARATSVLSALFAAQQGAVDTTSFTEWAQLYRSLGAATLVAAAAQLGRDEQFKRLLGTSCINRGDERCAASFAPAAEAMGSYIADRDPGRQAPWYARVWHWFSGGELGSGPVALVAAAVGSLVSLLVKLLAQMVASLTPYALACARGIAILVSVIGVYVLILPGRARDAFGLMIGPIAWVHVWTILFMVWYPFETIASDAVNRLPLLDSPTGDMAAQAVVRFVFATGYASLPYIAWKVVFGGLSRTVPRFPLDRMVAPVRTYTLRQIRRLLPRDARTRRGGGGPASQMRQDGRSSASAAGASRRARIPSNPVAVPATDRGSRHRG